MAKYRKKPVIIEAFQYDGDFTYRDGTPYEAPEWIFNALEDGTMFFKDAGGLYIKTLEGDHHTSVGDYIIQGVKGELYPCKPDIFEITYDEVSTEQIEPTITVNIENIHLSNDNLEALTKAISSGIVRGIPYNFEK